MNRIRLMGKFAIIAGIMLLLASATAALAFPTDFETATGAQPNAPAVNTLTLSGVVWNGPRATTGDTSVCPLPIAVNTDSFSTGVGGYEMRLNLPAGRFAALNSTTPAATHVNVGQYLTNGGQRTQAGTTVDNVTPPVLASVSGDSIKFGNYTWDAAPVSPGATAAGTLATVSVTPNNTCGTVAATLSEVQVVDINGAVIAGITNGTVNIRVNSRYDTNGAGGTIGAADVNAVVLKLGQARTICGNNYQFDTNRSGGTIGAADVNAVVLKLGQSITAACTQ